MILKWIQCSVPADNRAAFSIAQSKWSELTTAPGFIGQVGGWNTLHPEIACILGIWRDEPAYLAFMNHQHDDILKRNDQQRTFTSVDSRIYRRQFDLPGSHNDLVSALPEAGFLQVAMHSARRNRDEHHWQVQRDQYATGMKKAGMLAGAFSMGQHLTEEYLLTTLWLDEASHNVYTHDHCPKRKDAAPETELENVQNAAVKLIGDWQVLAAARN